MPDTAKGDLIRVEKRYTPDRTIGQVAVYAQYLLTQMPSVRTLSQLNSQSAIRYRI